MSDRIDARPLMVAAAGLVIGVAVGLRVMIPYGMDPAAYVAFFRNDSLTQIAYPSQMLGRPVTTDGLAHDGKYFFAQANDPWYLEPEVHAVVLDAPLYRAQRMLYPTIAGGFGLFPPGVVVWSLVLTNVIALAIGAALAARLATRWGYSPWLGLWVPVNVGLLLELNLGNAGVVAYTCCLAALLMLETERPWLASLLFAAAGLSREVMLLFAVGVFALWWRDRRGTPWRFVAIPVAAMGLWHIYIRARLNGIHGTGEAGTRNIAPPFIGLIQALRTWEADPERLLFNIVIVGIVMAFVPLALRSHLPIVWGALPFVGLAAILSVHVWRETYDFPRAVSPIFTAIPFLVAASRQDERRQEPMRALDPR